MAASLILMLRTAVAFLCIHFQFFTHGKFAFASEKLLRIQKYVLYDYVLASDDFWAIAVTRARKCKQCKRLKKSLLELSTLQNSSLRHVYKFAWADGYEYVEGLDGDEILFKDLVKIKSFPSLVLFPFGPKQLKGAVILDKNYMHKFLEVTDPISRLRRLKLLLQRFLPSKVHVLQSERQKELKIFTRAKDKHLRRVLLFSKASGVSPMYKKLSLLFDRRYVFGQSNNLKLANKFGLRSLSSSSLYISKQSGSNINVKLKRFTNNTWISALASIKKILMEESPNNSPPATLTYDSVYRILNAQEEYVNVTKINSKKTWMKECIKNPKYKKNKNHICVLGVFQFGDQAGGQELEAFQTLATKSILRTGFGDGKAGSIQVERMPLSFMWTYGELQDELMTEFILLRLPCIVIINPHKRYYSIRYGKIPLEVDLMRKFLFASLSGNTKLVKLPEHLDLENDVIQDEKQYLDEDDAFDLLFDEERKRKMNDL